MSTGRCEPNETFPPCDASALAGGSACPRWVAHRQIVFKVSKPLRFYSRFERPFLGELCQAAARTVIKVYRAASGRPDAVPGFGTRAEPRSLGSVDPAGDTRGVAVAGIYVYVADGDLRVIELNDLTAPKRVGDIDPDGYCGMAAERPGRFDRAVSP